MALHLHPDDGGEVFLEELEERLGLVIEPIPDVNFTMNVAVCVCALVALAVYLVLDQWAFVSGLLWRRGVWLTFTYLVYGSGVGGMVYCVIRTPPPFGVSQRQVQLFAMRSGSEQFVLEGVVMGVINLMVGLSFVGVYLMACQRKNRVVQFVGTCLFDIYMCVCVCCVFYVGEKRKGREMDGGVGVGVCSPVCSCAALSHHIHTYIHTQTKYPQA
jgi:hypothetical protein